ncbi:MAG: rhomboid family intramembrane serine protease [Bacteroidetes bacterium]|uniref:Rhomboid family intramembrane serine protease n=1 Tax=Candidatus Cryptobacteroides intestinavium TaxID=2840766 RepID=A0A9D9EQZ9_9BACT|nr:rhomboid family intramembrane serine protease [Candidatus Cryptobacteroides intestinavium]
MNYSYNRGGGFLSSWPPATKSIIIINVLIFIMTELNREFMIANFALFYPASPLFRPWQVVTHMFMHGGFWHIFFNMYTLFIFGSVLERVWGTKKYLLFYFVTGLGAAALHTGVQWIEAQHYMAQLAGGDNAAAAALHALKVTPTVGASGAIYGLLLGYGMLFPDAVLALIFPPVALKAKWFVIIFAVIELLTGITGTGGSVAHFAHLGGMLFGWLLIVYWKRRNRLYQRYD